LAKGIAEFVEDDTVEASEIVGDASSAFGSAFGLERTDENDGDEEVPRAPGRRHPARRIRPVGQLQRLWEDG
jgi:hypothetical protein